MTRGKDEGRLIGKIDGVILDVDGTLWDSTPIVAEAWTAAARDSGLAGYTVTADMLKKLFGKTMADIAAGLFPEETLQRQEKIMELCCVYEEEYLQADPCDICYPGVIDTIRALAARLPVFIVSNCQKGYIELFIEKTGVASCITDTECYGRTGKTKGENIRLLAQRNHLAAPVYVGDIQGDCDAAAVAGVPFIHAAYGFGDVDRMDARIGSFQELLELV